MGGHQDYKSYIFMNTASQYFILIGHYDGSFLVHKHNYVNAHCVSPKCFVRTLAALHISWLLNICNSNF